MGIGPATLALYSQLKRSEALPNIDRVFELGAQNVWCPPSSGMLEDLFDAFGRPSPPIDFVKSVEENSCSARDLHELLGQEYTCIDLASDLESIKLDLNFDGIPSDHVGKYDLVTNHGTTEHILNQANCFECMHDLCAVGGVMLHALPFTLQLDHGFFNYQPNLFMALAKYNGYDLIGMWIAPDGYEDVFIPWNRRLLDHLKITAETTQVLAVLLKKVSDTKFSVPLQYHYEDEVEIQFFERYNIVVDGKAINGARFRQLREESVVASSYKDEIQHLKNQILSLKGQVDAANHEVAALHYIFESGKVPIKKFIKPTIDIDTEAVLGISSAAPTTYSTKFLARALMDRIVRKIKSY